MRENVFLLRSMQIFWIKMSNKKLPTIIVDTREKQPILFEGDPLINDVVYTKLDFGDYSIQGLENHIIIERKSSVNELISNFSADPDRLWREFERMAHVKHKFFVIEETLADVLNPDKYFISTKKYYKNKYSIPKIVINGLLKISLEYNVHVIYAGNKGKNIIKGLLLKAFNDANKKVD